MRRGKACEKAFEYMVWFCGMRDPVEGFVATKVWPLGRNTWKDFSCEKMRLSIFSVEGAPFPLVGLQMAAGESENESIREALRVCSPVSHKELGYISIF